jgi:hypothetical protein
MSGKALIFGFSILRFAVMERYDFAYPCRVQT